MPAGGVRYEVAAELRRLDRDTVLVGGSPLTILRLAPAGADFVTRLLDRGAMPEGPAERELVRRLVELGMVVARPEPGTGPWSSADVTVVVPVKDRADELGHCLAALRHSGAAGVTVVDDASAQPEAIAETAAHHGARLVRREVNGGPAAARNTGLASVSTPLVAFVDTDVEVGDRWLERLLDRVDDEVALVAPRVVAPEPVDTAGVLERYEAERSPLDLGRAPGPIRPRSRVAYVPAAALVCRVEALRSIGGFDEGLRVGEDVDLVWRLVEAGWSCRYVGADVTVEHRVRPALGSWLSQRVAYGSAAASLDRRHPGDVAPLDVSPWSVAVWAAGVARVPVLGTAITIGNGVALSRRLAFLDEPLVESLRLVIRGHAGGGTLISRALIRPWFPLSVVAATGSRRVRRVLLLSAIIPPLVEWSRSRRKLDPARFVALSLADDVAYSVGVWKGCVQARSIGALLPRLRNWPGPAGATQREAWATDDSDR